MNRCIAPFAFIGLHLLTVACGVPAKTVDNVSPPPASPEKFVERFGKPDLDESNENEHPRTAFPTRRLCYKSEKVQVVFTAADNEIPTKSWKFTRFQTDPRADTVSEREFLKIMAYRDAEKEVLDAKRAAENKAREVKRQSEELEKLQESLRPKAHRNVTRANYEQIVDGMTLFQVEEILGPGPCIEKEAKGDGVLIVTWASGGPTQQFFIAEGVTVIAVTFHRNAVRSKSISVLKN